MYESAVAPTIEKQVLLICSFSQVPHTDTKINTGEQKLKIDESVFNINTNRTLPKDSPS